MVEIVKRCMVVNLQIGIWTGHRLDKDASREVTERADAASDAARVNKHLIPKDVLKPVNTAAGAIRTHFYKNTLPWKDNGDRLLVKDTFTDFLLTHNNLVSQFNNVVDNFLERDYLSARDAAEFRMGTLFKEDDYPRADTLRRRFYVGLDIDPVSTASDFRVDMDQAELDHIRGAIEKSTEERLGRAMMDVWQRLADVVGHFAEKMGSDGVFRDTTVKNLSELVDMLPALNILQDPELERIRQDVAANLTGIAPKDLRIDTKVRAEAAREAARIMEDMKGFMNAFAKE